MDKTSNKYHTLLIYVVLALAIIVAFEPALHSEFVFDDTPYITNNPHVNGGITLQSVIWAFTNPHFFMWHPLTTLSHMLDCELFELNPFWHHLVSLLFHITNALLLFWVLKRMTGTIWRSAFVAAVFALHPLAVESVAWVAERKSVLSSFFWMLTIAAYIRYTERPGIGRYLLVILALCLGLMAKPMLVTLPFILLLLDYWPLQRFQWTRQNTGKNLQRPKSAVPGYQSLSAWRLAREKIPLFIPVVVVSAITFIVQQGGWVVISIEKLPLSSRIANGLVSYISYIGKIIYPSRLAVFYPHPVDSLPVWQPIACLMILAVVSIGIIYTTKRWRYLTVGWLWYLGTLIPVIGLVQVGSQAMADRYTYLPSIGLLIMLAWGTNELLIKWRYRKITLAITAAAVLTVLSICTRMQLRHWQNNFTLYGHAVAVTENNHIMQNNYGSALLKKGRNEEAVRHIKKALRINPGYAKAHGGLGYALTRQGNLNEAIVHYTEALRLKPNWTAPMNNLAWILITHKEVEFRNPREAILLAERACELTSYEKPDLLDTLAAAYAAAGRFSDAVAAAEKALKLAQSSGQIRLAENIRNHLRLYRAGKPYIEPTNNP